ncbi:carbohydrate-binding module family 50 protein [Hebeloma cylindrosporum]|uniref:Carbohydrate-binding module family 50 protein n=1 Tax=Hebeloma cylindrosporum TaxID=76867 RepID=A0A0C3CNE0_HEBCY|nr:carbohydrate-binding module family 50 protein [Hebeloma cylindrosporum h7]
MSHDESDDLAYNPFAEQYEDSPGSIQTQGYFNSAFFPQLSSTRPTLRRRRSSLADRAPLKDSEDQRKHLRSRTEIHIIPHSAGLHPLKSALAVANGAVFQDVGITRPHLSRIVNEGSLIDVPSAVIDLVANKTTPASDEEKEVIVHNVTPKDSLAGVSLKYGISLSELRRANRLWPSDSIHRRELLYIPIDQASRAHEYIPEPSLMSFTPDEQDDIGSVFTSTSASVSPISRASSSSVPPSPSVALRKIPTKQLSYFPPTSNKTPDSNLASRSQINTPHLQPSSSPSSLSRYPSSSANSAFSSILTALPIAASTRDEIITRLSFDSVSSSFSDRSHTNSDEETGHELGEVATHKRPSGEDNENSSTDEVDGMLLPTPKASQRPSQLPSYKQPKPTASSSLPKSSHTRSHSSTSPPRFYLSHANETYVRTSQMEPSPAMQLPVFQNSTVGRSAGKRSQANGRHVRTGSLTLGRKRPNAVENGDVGLMLDSLNIDGPS